MKTKLHLIIMCLLLSIVGGGELYAWNYPTSKPSSPFSSGDGSSSKPYEIRDATAMVRLCLYLRKQVVAHQYSLSLHGSQEQLPTTCR